MEKQQSCNWWQKIKKFYTDNFATDLLTNGILLTLASTALSSLNLLIFAEYTRYVGFIEGLSIVFTFLLITSCTNYLFYKGWLSGQWPQMSFLVTLKSVEIAGGLGVLLSQYFFTAWWYLSSHFDLLIWFPLLVVLNVLYTWYIFQQIKEMKRKYLGNIYTINDFIQPLTSKEEKNFVSSPQHM